MKKIRVAIVGVGNCASSLVQGIHYYEDGSSEAAAAGVGLLHPDVGGYGPGDIEVVAAIDVDARKVGLPLHEAIFAPPNNTKVFHDRFGSDGVTVAMGNVLDGVADHMGDYPERQRFVVADAPNAAQADIVDLLGRSGAEILMNYLPVGSQRATEFYAECCLEAGVSLINCIPVFIVSEPVWARRFTEAGIPCIGDDVKAQVGATIVHRVLARLFRDRGAEIDATYQLNTGGNTDFLNMLNHSRLRSKRISKTDAVQSQLDVPLPPDQVHIGPSDYVPWQKDNKICFCRIEGRGFGGVPLNVELRLSVEDSPNSAGETIDAIRCCKLARQRGLAGPLKEVSAFTMKHPPVQMADFEALQVMNAFIAGQAGQARDGSYRPVQPARASTPAK
ncbi:MAG: inositol-3-phosphate synthase [Planctomycetota bacterium]|jgi:myo-inositol-1-phosphate synthase